MVIFRQRCSLFSVGLDIVEVSRIKKDVEKHGQRFVQRILGEKELTVFEQRKDKYQFLAGRFAAKEAVIKGLGQYFKDRPPYNVLQIVNDSSGRPELVLPDFISDKIGNVACKLSISHEKNYAVAVAVFIEMK